MHFPIAMEALKHGKHVYVQKPLCNTLRETRLLTEKRAAAAPFHRWASRCRR
jgi:predicted dehydrogenase